MYPWATAMKIPASKARNWLSYSDQDAADGQALVEYSLILVLVIIACVSVVITMGDVVREVLWGGLTSRLPF